MKPDQERVNNLLRDTVTLLCKNGLTYNDELRVEALIGVTVDSNDVFLVHINERFGPGGETKKISGSSSDVPAQEQRVNNGGGGLSISHNNSGASSRETPHQSPARPVQRTGSTDSGSVSSPGWGARGGVGSMPSTPQVDLSRVKLESVEAGEDGLDPEDCVMIMGRSPQAVARQAHMVAGQRRVLSHHASLHPSHHPHSQSSASQDDAQAMRRQYSQSLASSDGSFTDYDPDSSEPPIKVKKQAADGGEEDQGGGGGGGNTHTQNSTSTYFQQHHPPHTQHHPGGGPGSSQWPNLADIATQQAAHQAFQDDDSGGVGTLPGCSSWPLPAGSQRAMLQGTQGSDMLPVVYYGRAKPKYPNINLSSANIRNILTDQVVAPVSAQGDQVVAFRLVWRGGEEELEQTWRNIATFRETVDAVVKALPGVSFFVSSISGTVSIHSRKDQPTDIYPALAYWVVGKAPDFNESQLMGMMMKNGFGATVRQISQRRRQSDTGNANQDPFLLSNHKAATLFMVVKDYGKGYVREKLETMSSYTGGLDLNAPPAVKFVVNDAMYTTVLQNAQSRLNLSGFKLTLEYN